MEKLYLYSEAGKIQIIRQYGELSKEEYREEGNLCESVCAGVYIRQDMLIRQR